MLNSSEIQGDGAKFFEMIHPDDMPLFFQHLDMSLSWNRELDWLGRMNTAKGNTIWVKLKCVQKRDDNNTVKWDGFLIDFTQEKQVEIQLEQARMEASEAGRLASLGELAAGVAHEVNNPLAIIDGYSQRIVQMVKSGGSKAEKIEILVQKIRNNIQRVAKIVKGLQFLSGASYQKPSDASDLKGVVENAIDVVQEKIRYRGIDLRVDFGANSKVECHPLHIAQAMLNILYNAMDALEEVSCPKITILTKEIGHNVQIEISNNGPRIPLNIKEKMMDPFFTTKDVGQGTGLGLSVASSVIDRAGGALFLDDTQAETTFVIQIPIAKQESNVA